MIPFKTFRRVVKRGLSMAGESPLASASWEAIRTIVVVVAWTASLAIVGALVNLGFFILSLPEIVGLARGGSDTIEGGGVLSILLRLVVALGFVFTSPAALIISLVYLAGFPLLWTWIGLRHGWSLSLQRWEVAVRRHVREFAALVSRSAPSEAVDAVRATARGMGEVLGKLLAVQRRSGRIVRWLSRKPAAIADQLFALLHELPGHESAEAAERVLEDVGRRIRFALPAAILWGVLANLVWFLGIKFFL